MTSTNLRCRLCAATASLIFWLRLMMCVSHSLSTCGETRAYACRPPRRRAETAAALKARRRRVFFFGRAGADPVVLEPDNPDRRALHDIYVAVAVEVDGVHRRRALAMDAGGQQRRRQSDNNASHAMALCYAWP